jgi:HAD superfamily hydrolase (TIGR01549 family)
VNHPIEAVLFDLDGTLRENEPPLLSTFFHYARDLGLPISHEQERAAARWIHAYWADSNELRQDRSLSQDEMPQLWQAFARRQLEFLGAPESEAAGMAAAIEARMQSEYHPTHRVASCAPELLDELTEAGLKLAVVSNRRESIAGLLQELELADRFELSLVAGEVGFWKPDPRLLELAAERLGVAPSRALYVGDNYFADARAAQDAGMTAVLLDPEDLFPEADCQVIRDLGELSGLLAFSKQI